MIAAIALLAIGGYGVYSATGSSGPVVPNVFSRNFDGGDLAQSYSALRALGLGVHVDFIDNSALDASSDNPPMVLYMQPSPGKHFRRGDAVTLVADRAAGLASPVFLKSNPRPRVPNFVGRNAESAIRWADKHDQYWEIPELPPLGASSARQPQQFYAAYWVTAQEPKPGTVMRQWHRTASGGYVATRLTLTVVTAAG